MSDIFDQLAAGNKNASSGDIFDTLSAKQQGGELYEGQTKLDGNAQRQADEQGQIGSSEGVFPSDVRMQEPNGGEERERDIDPSQSPAELRRRRSKEQVSGDIFDQLAAKGGEVDEESTKTKSKRTQAGQEDGQGIPSQGSAGNEAEIGLRKSWVPTPTREQTGDTGDAIVAAGVTGAKAYAGLKAGELASKQTGKFIAKQVAKKLAGSVAATLAAPFAAAETVATGGIGAPLAMAIEMTAYAAGDWAAEKAFNFVEGLIGVDEKLEEERAKNPALMKVASLAGMAPMAVKSLRNYASVAEKQGAKEAAKLAAAGAVGGAAFEPIRYGVEAGLGAVTGQEEGPAPITAGSVAESALMGGVLAAHGANEIAKTVGPLTAKEAVKTETEPNAEKDQKKRQYFSESAVMNRADATLRDLEKRQNSGEELSETDKFELQFLQSMPDAEKIASTYGFGIKKPVYSTEEIITGKIQEAQDKLALFEGKPDTVANRKKKATLQSTIDKLQLDISEGRTLEGQDKAKEVKTAEAPAEAQPEITSETKEPKAGGVSDEQGVAPELETEIQAEEGTTQRGGEGKEEVAPVKKVNRIEQAGTEEEVQLWADSRVKELVRRQKEGIITRGESNRQISSITESVNKRLKELEKVGKEGGKPKAKLVQPEKELPAKPKGKRVLAAAYRRKNPETGKMEVFYGANHQHALHHAGLSWKEIKEKYAHPEQREGKEFGYKTDTHKFVSRPEGEQVARGSKQADNLGIDKDKLSGLQMHSNRLTLDEYPGAPEAGVSVGAARSGGFEFGQADRESNLTKGAEIHQAGVKGFEDWKKKFLAEQKGKKQKYTERQLFSLFEQSERLASYSTNYEKPLGEAIKNDEFWSKKTPEEIKDASKSRRTQAIQVTNENIDKERVARGLPPVMKEASVEWKSDWEEGMRRIDNDADYGPRLVSSLKSNMRSISNPDKAVLSHQTLEAMNDRDAKAAILAKTTDPRLIATRSRELDEAQQKFDELSELSARTNSEAGRALNFIKTLIGADYSLESLLVRAMAKNRRMGGSGDVTKEERAKLSELSDKVIKANDAFSKDLAASKQANVANRVMEFIEFTQGVRRVSAGEAQPTPKQEMQRFFGMLNASPNDPMSVGLAIRGMARSIADGMGLKGKITEKQANEIIDEVHAKMQKVMGDSWTKTQTNDALQGNGAFTQFAETDLKNAVDASIRSQEEFVKAYESILKIKNVKERNRRLDLLAEKRNIEFENIESQMKSIVDEELVDISKYIGELDYELRSCE